jgi:hypothetical protein
MPAARRLLVLALVLPLLGLGLAACGDPDSKSGKQGTTTTKNSRPGY